MAISRSNKAEEVYSYIKNQILSGTWNEGERLNDSLLSEQIGVSRTSVREALFRLVESGVVDKEYWKGYFIKEVTDDMVSDLIDLRITLESASMRNFVKEFTYETIDKLQKIIDDSRVYLEKGQYVDYLSTDYSFHETIYHNQHNQYIISALDNLQLVIHMVRRKSMGTDKAFIETAQNSIKWHQKILDAIKARDVDESISVLVAHLKAHQNEAKSHIHHKSETID